MISSKLFDILPRLSDLEMKKLGEFLDSPFFNKSRNMKLLFKIYRTFHPLYNDKKFTKEYVFSKLFPHKEYNDELMRNMNSDLTKLSLIFLGYLNIQSDAITVPKHILTELNKKNIHSLFEKNFLHTLSLIEDSKNRDSWYYLNRYLIYMEKDLYNAFKNEFIIADVKEVESNLVKYFLLKLLEIYCYILNQLSLFKIDYEYEFIDELKYILKKNKYKDSQALYMHKNRFLLHLKNEEQYYTKLRHLTDIYGDILDTVNHYDSYICMINYVKRNWNENDEKTIREVFELRRKIFNKHVLIGDFHISHTVFLNQVKSGLVLSEFDWVINFINEHKDKIPEKYGNSTYNLCMAVYSFEKGDFNAALQYLSNVKYNAVNFHLDGEMLRIKIFYETGDFDGLEHSLNALKQYLSANKKISEKGKSGYTKFIKYMNSILNLQDSNRVEIASLLRSVSNDNFPGDLWMRKILQKYSVKDKLIENSN